MRIEKAFCAIYAQLRLALKVDGGENIPLAFLCDGAGGEIGGRKIAGIDSGSVLKKVYLAALRRRRKKIFSDEKTDGQSAFGGKFYIDTVGEDKLGRALEGVGNPVKNAVEGKRTGLRG